jgi:hypothetical protein
MLIDERTSEELQVGECHRLLALGVRNRHHGHLGVPQEGAPLVVPVNYLVYGSGADVMVRLGEFMFEQVQLASMVSFQVDGVDVDRPWSVLVRGPATELPPQTGADRMPSPPGPDPGHHVVSIRGDLVTGRLLGVAPIEDLFDEMVAGPINSL